MSPAAPKPLPPERFEELLTRAASSYRLTLEPDALAALSRFLSELDRWRRKTNLTGNLSAEELAIHSLESVFGAGLIEPSAEAIDIGSGAGFPGIPIAIARPDLAMTLLEPRTKRAAFLRHVARVIPLTNTSVIDDRLENLPAGSTFDVATARAVGGLPERVGVAPFLKERGVLILWTTDSGALESGLYSRFAMERMEHVPGSRRRVIALFRKLQIPFAAPESVPR